MKLSHGRIDVNVRLLHSRVKARPKLRHSSATGLHPLHMCRVGGSGLWRGAQAVPHLSLVVVVTVIPGGNQGGLAASLVFEDGVEDHCRLVPWQV